MSDSEDDNDPISSIFKAGVVFDVDEEEEIRPNASPCTLINQLEYLFLLRKIDVIQSIKSSLPASHFAHGSVDIMIALLTGRHPEVYLHSSPSGSLYHNWIAGGAAIAGTNEQSDKIHARVVLFISSGLDPEERQWRALQCMLIGYGLLELYSQANYTGPELPAKTLAAIGLTTGLGDGHNRAVAQLASDGEWAVRHCSIPDALVASRCILAAAVDPTKQLWGNGFELNDKGEIVTKLYPLEKTNLTAKQAVGSLKTRHWLAARACIVHLRLMHKQAYDIMPTLWNEAKDLFAAAQASFNDLGSCPLDASGAPLFSDAERKLVESLLWLEVGLSRHHFQHSDKGKSCFQRAKESVGLDVNLTAALGKRTKYQQTAHAQMYVYAKSHVVEALEHIDIKKDAKFSEQTKSEEVKNNVVSADNASADAVGDTKTDASYASNIGSGEVNSLPRPQSEGGFQHGVFEVGRRLVVEGDAKSGEEAAVREVKLDDTDGGAEENILLEGGPKYIDEVDKGGELHAVDMAVLLALCLDVNNSNPADGLTTEEMMPYITRVLEVPKNWMVHSTALLERSWLEYEKRRTADRALLQIQALLDQHTTRLTVTQASYAAVEDASPVQDRLAFVHALVYPAQYELKADLADKYLRCQVFVSALNLYTELEMWDEVVKCYQLLDKPFRAEMVVRERLKEAGETPYMLTALGDLTRVAEHYERAWVLSHGRYARAKRSLAHLAYEKGDYDACIAHLDAALAIQPLVATAWYLRGIASMRTQNWAEALVSFNRCIQQDAEIGEAWANIGAVHYHCEQYDRAYPAFKEALKHKPNNWKVLENLVIVGIHLQKYMEACQYMKSAISQRHASEQPVYIVELKRLVMGILTKQDPPASEGMLKIVEELLVLVSKSYPLEADVWDVFAVFMDATGRPTESLEYRFKQVRTLVQVPKWEMAPASLNKLLGVSGLLVDAVKARGAKADVYGARALLTTMATALRQCVSHGAKLELPATDAASSASSDAGATTTATTPKAITSYEEAVSVVETLTNALPAQA